MELVRTRIRDVPDFPKKGIVFKDITPVLEDPAAFAMVMKGLVDRWKGERVQKVVAIESRGFIFGAPLACALGAGFVIARKPGKLPSKTLREAYGLEYGTDSLEIHADAIEPGERVLIVDDVLATGGTAEAAGKLVRRLDGQLLGYAFVIELGFLKGAERLGRDQVHALLTYA
jgi:adenine phosphoribosyltransferase